MSNKKPLGVISSFDLCTEDWDPEKRKQLEIWAGRKRLPLDDPYVYITIGLWNIEITARNLLKRNEHAIDRMQRVHFVAVIILAVSLVLSNYVTATIAFGHGYSSGKTDGFTQAINQLSKLPR